MEDKSNIRSEEEFNKSEYSIFYEDYKHFLCSMKFIELSKKFIGMYSQVNFSGLEKRLCKIYDISELKSLKSINSDYKLLQENGIIYYFDINLLDNENPISTIGYYPDSVRHLEHELSIYKNSIKRKKSFKIVSII